MGLLLSPTAHLKPKRHLLRWLPRRIVRELSALLDAAQRPTGSAALTTFTALPLSPTAPWQPRRIVRELSALLDAAQRPTGSAVLTTFTALPLNQIVLFTSTRPCSESIPS